MTQLNMLSFNEVQVSYNIKDIGPEIKSSQSAFNYLVDRWENIDYCEKMYVLLLNRRNRILGVAFISEGSVGGTVADPKKIFQIALKANASGIIIAHNHPSNVPNPSTVDINLTKKLKEAGHFLELPVLDHIIITKDTFYSFADEGQL